MAIQLVTFGGLRAGDDTNPLDWLLSQNSRAALFVYLAVEQRVARETLTSVFWPESDAENARHALRQSLYQVRKVVGRDWVQTRAHELVIASDVHADANAFTSAIDRGDLEGAIALYRGPFLDGIHLVDLKPWENWVDARRAQYARAFRKASRDLLDAKRAAGDAAGAVAIAERWVARDPLDEEAQHRFIESLAVAGERTEAIRQYETYVRALEPEGLQPLDETAALAHRLRADSGVLPPLQPVRAPAVQTALGAAPAVGQAKHVSDRRIRFLVPAVASIVLLVGLSWAFLARRGESASRLDATTIAVLPFTVHGGDRFAYLGDGVVNLLGAALDGAGSIRPADTRAVFAAAGQLPGSASDRARAERIAQKIGGAMYVLGDIVESSGQLQIEATVYRIRGAPIARATVTGSADSAFALVDRLAARLLGGLGDPAADRLLRTASLTTASLPAFKSYLQGEELMRASRFEQAADAYLTAINLDSTFALAHYRLALAREWAPLPGEDDAAAAAARQAGRLSARDRAFLEAFRQWRSGDAIGAERAYQTLLTRYPEDLDAWFQLGEIQFHHGPLIGHPIWESAAAWRKIHVHEPRSEFVATHLARISVVSDDSPALDSVLANFTPGELRDDRRLVELALLRAMVRADTAVALSVAKNVTRWEPFAVWRAAVWVAAFCPDPGLGRLVMRELLDGYESPGLRADMLWFASMLDLAGGRSSAAQTTLAEAAESERATPREKQRDGFADITEWFATTLPLPYSDSSLRVARERASAARSGVDPLGGYKTELGLGMSVQFEPIRQYTIGVLSLRLHDKSSAVRAADSLRRFAASEESSALIRDLDRGLRARIAVEEGRNQDALLLLSGLETEDTQGDIAAVPFASRAGERYIRGEILVSLGNDREALRWFASLGDGSVGEIPMRAMSHLRQAEIYVRLRETDEARKHFSRTVDLWSGADREFRGILDYARRQLAALGR